MNVEINEQVEALIADSRLAFIQGKNAEALSLAKEAIKLDSKQPDAYLCAGNARMSFEQYDKAVENYKKAVECDPDNGDRFFHLGYALSANNQEAEGLAALAKADEIGTSPEVAGELYKILGMICFDMRRYNDAIINLCKAETIIGIDMATPLSFSVWKEEDIKKTVRVMKVLRGLRLASVLASVSNLCLTEEEFEQHKLLKKRNTFNICCINEAREVLNNAKVVGEDGNIECPTLLFSSNGKDQEIDWVLNQQKFAEIMGAKLISYDCEHYIHHFKSDEMSEEIFRFVNSFIL